MSNQSIDAAHSGHDNNHEPEWRNILHSLNQGQYDRAEALLVGLQQKLICAENPDLKVLFSAALLLCMNCAHLKTQAEIYRNTFQDALKREHELRNDLTELLAKVMDSSFSYSSESRKGTQGRKPSTPSAYDPNPRPSIWRGIKNLFTSNLERVSTDEADALPPGSPSPDAGAVKIADRPRSEIAATLPMSLYVFCLGKFQVYLEGNLITTWPASKGKSIFKYLITHRENPTAKDILMELFWPNSSPESARRNLNWAIHNLRQILHKFQPDIPHVIFQDECYFMNPDLKIWTDVDEFEAHIATAQSLKDHHDISFALQEYQAAELLYQGEFLEEDRYEDWVQPRRQSLQDAYLHLLDCVSRYHYDQQRFDETIHLCSKMLTIDPCREEAHMRLMQCYYRRGQPYLAIRQYQICVERLKTELDVSPTQQTSALYDAIRLGKDELPGLG